jgi:O-antigen/teichoic acid export membrane protein
VWLGLSLVRGALQGDGQIGVVGVSLVGEALGRWSSGSSSPPPGPGSPARCSGTPLAMVVVGALLLRRLGPPAQAPAEARRLGVLVVSAATPIAALALLMLLQNVDVIVAKHRLDDDAAGAYAAAAVAAKGAIWVAVGLSGYVVPEAAPAGARGEPALAPLRLAAGLIAVLAVPVAVIFALVPSLLLELASARKYTSGADALLPLGAAMALLACALLGSQYLLALHRARFLVVLARGRRDRGSSRSPWPAARWRRSRSSSSPPRR